MLSQHNLNIIWCNFRIHWSTQNVKVEIKKPCNVSYQFILKTDCDFMAELSSFKWTGSGQNKLVLFT